MSEDLDNGDIVAQEKIEVQTYFTANELYKHVLELEKKVFIDSLPELS